jgi:hypothetical protein
MLVESLLGLAQALPKEGGYENPHSHNAHPIYAPPGYNPKHKDHLPLRGGQRNLVEHQTPRFQGGAAEEGRLMAATIQIF